MTPEHTPEQDAFKRQLEADAAERFALTCGDEIIYCEGSFMCACENEWFVSTAARPMGFVWCPRCAAGAIVLPWGGV